MLVLENLTCGYNGTSILNDVSFTVRANEKLFIIGPNGCGKTTLLRAIAGLIPFSGQICIDHVPTTHLNKRDLARKIALMSQISTVYFSYTVYETVMQGRYAHIGGLLKRERRIDRDIVLSCLEETGLLALRDRNIKELSGGQLQRVFLARTFAQEPQIILLDEPTNHLDFRHQLDLMHHINRWVKKPGRAVIGVMHDMNLALSFSDRLIILRNGGLFAQGRSDSLDLDLINHTFDTDIRGHMVQSLKKWERQSA